MKNDEKFLDKCIKTVFISIFIFTGIMIILFALFRMTPDVLIQYFFVYVVGELLCCALIKTTKPLFINWKIGEKLEKKNSKQESHEVEGDRPHD